MSFITALLQQQAARTPSIPTDMGLFTPEQIARCLGSPVENVRVQWPLVVTALQEFGIADEPVQVAAIATVGVETGAFLPIPEWDGGYAYEGREDLGNTESGDGHRYLGRGLIQLTGRSNYRFYGEALGIDLEGNPDLALEDRTSARVLAYYFLTHGLDPKIPASARAGRWNRVRMLVNGGTNGLGDFLTYVERLQAVRHGG